MGKCKRQSAHKRVSKKRGNPSNYRNPIKGHTWEGHGDERKCKHCGLMPCKPKK